MISVMPTYSVLAPARKAYCSSDCLLYACNLLELSASFSFLGFTAQSGLLFYLCYVDLYFSPMCVSGQLYPVTLSAYYLIGILFQLVYWHEKAGDGFGAGKWASSGWVPALRISGIACVCSATTTFRTGHWGTPQLCKDEGINCWDRRAERNGQSKR